MCRQRNMETYGICDNCKAINNRMRKESCDLSGRFAVVTGGRIKIGYAVCLRLLRMGASVIAVTRYPKIAMQNYMQEADYPSFADRLHIIGFDLLRVDRINELMAQIAELCDGRLDILVNNAAQTVKKSTEYYAELTAREEALRLTDNTIVPITGQINMPMLMPSLMPADYGEKPRENSWTRMPEEITPQELLEVQLINVTAPFLLTNGLRKYMRASENINKFVINVSSVEGRFNTKQKLARHVHTNMAKASLNMMTHSIASDFARDNIYVYSCDPGWVSNQFPPAYEISRDFEPYLTFEDGAARVLYPVVKNCGEQKIKDSGSFYKDYRVIDY